MRSTKPFPFQTKRVRRSPFKTLKSARKAEQSYHKGLPIGFTATSSLKSMGRIPRATGYYVLGDKYKSA